MRTVVGVQTANPLLTNPLTPFLQRKVFLTLEGSGANFRPANFVWLPKTPGCRVKMVNYHILSNFLCVCLCVCARGCAGVCTWVCTGVTVG